MGVATNQPPIGNFASLHQLIDFAMPPTVVRYEPKGMSKPAIYTFLGLASLPRFLGRGGGADGSCKEPVTMSVLVDLVQGCATFGLNGLAGPCVRFPAGDTWRSGVQVVAQGFPLISPMDGDRCIVLCSTPPTPPSMLAAASHPRTVAEHLAAGSLRTPTPPGGGGINWGGVD